MMEAGKLRCEVLLEQPVRVQDEFGALTETWQSFATVFAAVESIVSDEVATSPGSPVEVTTISFVMRYLQGVTSDMRVRYDGRTFKINSVIDLGERRVTMALRCTELGR